MPSNLVPNSKTPVILQDHHSIEHHLEIQFWRSAERTRRFHISISVTSTTHLLAQKLTSKDI